MKKREPLDERKEAFLREHLPYEIEMLRFAFAELQRPHVHRLHANSLIECFCLHARNLTSFLKKKEEIRPHLFTVETGGRVAPDYDDKLYAKLSAQILHLSEKRTIEASEKIGPEERLVIYRAIEAALRRFIKSLKPVYADQWSSPSEIISFEVGPVGPTLPANSATPSATNAMRESPD